jgi:ATP/maltotriose-dependent transcriptional regulator MalT
MVWFAVLSGNAADALDWIRIALQADGDADPAERTFVRCVVAVADTQNPHGAGDEEAALAGALAELEAVDGGDWPPIVLFRAVLSWVAGDRDAALERMREAEDHPAPWVRAAAPLVSAQLAENDGDLATQRANHETALARFRAIGDRWGIAIVLVSQAGVWMIDGELDAAAGALEEARALTRELGVPSQDVFLDMRLAELWTRRGDLARAREHLDQVEDERDLNREEAVVIDALRARLLWELGDRAEARALRDRLVAAVDGGIGRPDRGHARAMALTTVGLIALGEGDVAAAAEAIDGAFAAAVQSRDMPIVAMTGVAAAQLAARRGCPVDAAEILGAAAVVRGAEDAANLEIGRLSAELREVLGEDAFRAAYARGLGAERDAALARLEPAGSDAASVGP